MKNSHLLACISPFGFSVHYEGRNNWGKPCEAYKGEKEKQTKLTIPNQPKKTQKINQANKNEQTKQTENLKPINKKKPQNKQPPNQFGTEVPGLWEKQNF